MFTSFFLIVSGYLFVVLQESQKETRLKRPCGRQVLECGRRARRKAGESSGGMRRFVVSHVVWGTP